MLTWRKQTPHLHLLMDWKKNTLRWITWSALSVPMTHRNWTTEGSYVSLCMATLQECCLSNASTEWTNYIAGLMFQKNAWILPILWKAITCTSVKWVWTQSIWPLCITSMASANSAGPGVTRQHSPRHNPHLAPIPRQLTADQNRESLTP